MLDAPTRLFAEKTGLLAEAERMALSGVSEGAIFGFLFDAWHDLVVRIRGGMIAGLVADRVKAGGTVDDIMNKLVPEIASIEADGNLFVDS